MIKQKSLFTFQIRQSPIKRLKRFFPWFGAKWKTINQYPEPKKDLIVEPFAGAANYAVRYPSRDILLCDMDENIIDVWRYLIETSEEEILDLPDIEMYQNVDDLPVSKPARKLIGLWLTGAATAPRKTPSAWMRTMDKSKCQFWGPGVRERISSQQKYIRHWRILQGSYLDLENENASWFVDPPYQAAGICYRHSSKNIDYERLGKWCKNLKGQVIVCENQGASWLPFQPFGEHRGVRKTSKEAIWIGGHD